MRVLVVDDSAFMRRSLSALIEADPDLEVVDTAHNGRVALEKTKRLKPDVITLDIEMPVMDGLTALRRIMSECPTPVVMCSSLTTEGSHAALRALKLGAVDVIAKDASHISLKVRDMQNDLVTKVKIAGRSRILGRQARRGTARVEERIPCLHPCHIDIIVIGSSTGGPPVVETILSSFPANLSMPVIVAQHMPVLFTKSLAERLNDCCAIEVLHGADGMVVGAGKGYILPGELHGRVHRAPGQRLRLEISSNPKEALFRPSVNELMDSAAKACAERTLGIMLTGMGDDGVHGARSLVRAGGKLLAQSEETCVVYGMPKAVTQEGLAMASLSPQHIVQSLRPLHHIARAG